MSSQHGGASVYAFGWLAHGAMLHMVRTDPQGMKARANGVVGELENYQRPS
jgi:hypothetical protein